MPASSGQRGDFDASLERTQTTHADWLCFVVCIFCNRTILLCAPLLWRITFVLSSFRNCTMLGVVKDAKLFLFKYIASSSYLPQFMEDACVCTET